MDRKDECYVCHKLFGKDEERYGLDSYDFSIRETICKSCWDKQYDANAFVRPLY